VALLREQDNATNAIQSATAVAHGNLRSHVDSLDVKYQDAATWANNVLQEQAQTVELAQTVYPYLESLPARSDFVQYLPRLGLDKEHSQEDELALADFVRPEQYQSTKNVLQKTQQYLRTQTTTLQDAVEGVRSDMQTVAKSIGKTQSLCSQISKKSNEDEEEINVLANKIVSDCSDATDLIAQGRGGSQLARIASLQTNNYLPLMMKYYDAIVHSIQEAYNRRGQVADEALVSMQNIASVEGTFAVVQARLLQFDLPEDGADAYEMMSVISQLPFVYGMLLIEAGRRKEWSDKLRTESAVLAEDIARVREEEQKRRKKWMKSIGHLLGEFPTGSAMEFDLNLQPGKDDLPEIVRADVTQFLEALSGCPGLASTMTELSTLMNDLDKPAKKQLKRSIAFKAGSIYEASRSRGSSSIKDIGELSALKELNLRLEEELKGQKSRVRKLENLVFNQTQTSRTNSSNLFNMPGARRPESPVPSPDSLSPMPSPKSNVDLLSRKASSNSRRVSANNSQDEKLMARRVVLLEAELHEEKQKSQQQEKNLMLIKQTQLETHEQLEQARATSKDLLGNLDAQQREYADERRMLQEEVSDWKRKLEDVEDELERMSGSRENEKLLANEELHTVREQLDDAERKLNKHSEEEAENKTVLTRVHNDLQVFEKDEDRMQAHQDLLALIHSLARLSDQATLHMSRLQDAVNDAKQDNLKLQHDLDHRSSEMSRMAEAHRTLEQQMKEIQASLNSWPARTAALETEIIDGREQLRTLRAKFAEGETGSEVLRQRLEHQAARAADTATALAEANAEVERLKHELLTVRSKHSEKGDQISLLEQRLESRTAKDVELSNRLAGNVHELARLLEALGLCVLAGYDGAMSIQRTSRLSSTSTSQNLLDSTTSTSLTSPTSPHPQQQPYDLTIPGPLLSWPHASTLPEEDHLFSTFLTTLSALSLPALSDAILKLRRDVEWTGKKWKAEARSYRSQLHAASLDAAGKIAFRNFKEGDLALWLPTRGQKNRPWAAFNVGAPHWFLREESGHKLERREWLVARIVRVQERRVNLGATMGGEIAAAGKSNTATTAATSPSDPAFPSPNSLNEDDNPFELADGLVWYLVDAVEEKPSSNTLSVAGLRTGSAQGKSAATVASACVDAKGLSARLEGKDHATTSATGLLGKNLKETSRRSSTTSVGKAGSVRRAIMGDGASDVGVPIDGTKGLSRKSSLTSMGRVGESAGHAPSGLGVEVVQDQHDGDAGGDDNNQVRTDQLWGP